MTLSAEKVPTSGLKAIMLKNYGTSAKQSKLKTYALKNLQNKFLVVLSI